MALAPPDEVKASACGVRVSSPLFQTAIKAAERAMISRRAEIITNLTATRNASHHRATGATPANTMPAANAAIGCQAAAAVD